MGECSLVSISCHLSVVGDQLKDSDCDSPMSLVNMTFDWIKKEWAEEVDFVIWTGDNARSAPSHAFQPS